MLEAVTQGAVHVHDRIPKTRESSFVEGFGEQVGDEKVGFDKVRREDEE